jgi:multidrug resistance efflux pump
MFHMEPLTSYKKPVLVNRPVVWMAWFREQWPVLLWLVVCAAVFAMYGLQAETGRLMEGLVDAKSVMIAPVDSARLISIDVAEGETVRQGQVLGRMDLTQVIYDQAMDRVALARAQTGVFNGQQNILQAFYNQAEYLQKAESDLKDVEVQARQSEGELQGLREEYKRRQVLFEKKVITPIELTELKPQIEALEKAAAAYPPLLQSLRENQANARRQYETMKEWLGTQGGADVVGKIQQQVSRGSVPELEGATRVAAENCQSNSTLVAPFDGIVSAIYRTPGDTVLGGSPVMRMVQAHSDRVVAYLPETDIETVRVGDGVQVWRANTSRRQLVSGRVETLSPEIHVFSWTVNSQGREQPVRSRKVSVRLIDKNDLIPGEGVVIGQPSRVSRWLGCMSAKQQ